MAPDKWDTRFMLLAHEIAEWSKEHGRRVGAVIVGPDRAIRSTGFNGLPRGVNDDPDDPAHIGFEGLRSWVDEHHPRHIVHGHVHPIAGLAATSFGDTRVHWISGARMLQLD